MAAKFQLLKTSGTIYFFSLVAENGQILLTSNTYASKKAAINGIKSVVKNSTNDAQFKRVDKGRGEGFFFTLDAGSGQIIAKSQIFQSLTERERCVTSVRALARRAEISEISKLQTREVPTEATAFAISTPLVLQIEPGKAKASDLAELFHQLSVLYQMIGGTGLTFYYEQSTERVGANV